MSKWHDAGSADLAPGQFRTLELDGIFVAIVNLGGELLAIEDRCTHDGSPLLGCGLSVGELVEGDQVICPRHGARFCLRTGEALSPPAYEPIGSFRVRIHQDRLEVELP